MGSVPAPRRPESPWLDGDASEERYERPSRTLRRRIRKHAGALGLGLVWLLAAPLVPAVGEEADTGQTPVTEQDEPQAASGSASAAEPGVAPAADAPDPTPRGYYNAGLEALRAGDHAAAAEAFLAARDRAGHDAELRYRAAFNLGLALAVGAGEALEVTGDADPAADGSELAGGVSIEAGQRAIAALRQSAAWFGDAVRLAPPGDDDARINLEIVSRRILELADSLRDPDRLRSRLDRLIDDQRGVRDQVRHLLAEVQAEAATTEPVGFKDAHDDLASRERALSAEVSDAIDLATEERLFIEQTPEDERTPEQRIEVWQLTALSGYLERARQSLDDARRRLRRLEGERGHRRADVALAQLKRAREQLLDPVTVLGAVARDEAGLIAHTDLLAAPALGSDRPTPLDRPMPGWLTTAHLAERQEDAAARAGEVLARFEGAVSRLARERSSEPAAEAPSIPPSEPAISPDHETPAQSPETQRMLRAAARAAPVLADAVDAMHDAVAALRADDPARAVAAEQRALGGLRQAIEEFAGVRQLIELAHGDQQGIVALLANDTGETDEQSGLGAAERVQTVGRLATDNTRRLDKLKPLLEEESARAATRIAAEAPEGEREGAAGDARQAVERRYEQAETLRLHAVEGLRELSGALDRETDDATGARAAADAALVALDELRRLFFSVVEHLEALRADQADTHDRTATLQTGRAADVETLAAGLGLVGERQQRHERLAGALATALAKQADAAAAAVADGAAGPVSSDEDAGARLAEAAEEVRKAGGRMRSAGALLADAATRAASPVLEPALTDQMAAVEHLENALRALVPPDQARQGQNPEAGQQPGQEQMGEARPTEAGSTDDEPISRRQALKRLQAIRDREAERHRRRGAEGPGREPVEKDW